MEQGAKEIIIFLLCTALIIILLIGFIIMIFIYHKRKEILNITKIEKIKSEYERMLLSSQLEMQEQTLRNISREIHDNIGLTLTMAKLNLNTIENSEDILPEKIGQTIELISKSIIDLTYLSRTLNSDFISDNGLIYAIEAEIRRIKNLGLFKIAKFIKGDPVFMDTQKELIIFRIIQEALNNSIKYSKAKSLILNLIYSDKCLEVQISDDGVGFNPGNSTMKHQTGSGLINIRQRALMIDGISEIISKPGEGTRINIRIPY